MRLKKVNMTSLSTFLVVSTIPLSLFFYLFGIKETNLFSPVVKKQQKFLQRYIEKHDPDLAVEKLLAEGYWLRYEDVKKDRFWGKNGPMGIWGPRDHFLQHGKKEGRIFKPVHHAENIANETKLAEAYWQRYPSVSKSDVWGRKSQLGILGPRDHFRYLGRLQGKVWGIKQEKQE